VSKNMRASMWIVGLAIALVVLLVASMNSMQTVDETEPSSAKTTTGAPPIRAPEAEREDTTATVSTSTIKTASPATVYAGGLYVEPWGHAARAAKELEAEGKSDSAEAASVIAEEPVAIWLSSFYDEEELVDLIERNITRAEKYGTTPVFVTYDIPNRDCGGESAGGAESDAEYLEWNQLVVDNIRGHRAVILVEPDSVGHISTCPEQAVDRTDTLRAAVAAMYDAGIPAYLDGGNSTWVDAQTMADRLKASGIDEARGFFTNVANYNTEDAERAYAEELADLVGGDVHYVIDVGRNGTGWRGTWCNGEGAGLGRSPRVAVTGNRIDAFLWVKTPGASDGRCTGGPAAGKWFPTYAEDLVSNRAE
jgi:endoglucanase